VTGYSTPERDAAFLGGELDAFGTADDHLTGNNEWIEKNIVDLHAGLEVPKGEKYPRCTHLPELESFAKSDRERKVLALFRNLRLTGSPYFAPPGTPSERIEMLKFAFTKTLNDPGFYKEYKKLVSDEPTPLLPDENQKAINELPRDKETVALFKQLAGPAPLPKR
jgi:hypothetical protein